MGVGREGFAREYGGVGGLWMSSHLRDSPRFKRFSDRCGAAIGTSSAAPQRPPPARRRTRRRCEQRRLARRRCESAVGVRRAVGAAEHQQLRDDAGEGESGGSADECHRRRAAWRRPMARGEKARRVELESEEVVCGGGGGRGRWVRGRGSRGVGAGGVEGYGAGGVEGCGVRVRWRRVRRRWV